jgi:hypothetical protein
MTQQTGKSLYRRDFGTRPLLVLGAAVIVAALVTVVAVALGIPLIVIAAVLVLAAGVAGFLTATTHLEVTPGRIVARSRLRERAYDAADLTLERRASSNVFVLAPRDEAHKVVCTFSDDDVAHVEQVFATAGVTITPPQATAAPDAESPGDNTA